MTGIFHTGPKTRNYWYDLSEMSGSFIESIPSFDKHLDSFFDRNAAAIIEEWDLVTDESLLNMQRKLDYLSYEVGRLMVEKENFMKRIHIIRLAIEDLEKIP